MKLIDAEESIRKQRNIMECLYAKSISEFVDHIAIDDDATAYMFALKNYAERKQWYHYLKGVLDSAPEVDADPVRYGKWLNAGGDWTLATCSECGGWYDVSDEPREENFKLFAELYRYCPHCGAQMQK